MSDVADKFQRTPDGKLAANCWPGLYPLYYLMANGDVLCPKCANADAEEPLAAEANYEDPSMHCEGCSKRIPSAYAEDEALALADAAMKAKGYAYRLDFPEACAIEPLYVKSPDHAARLLRMNYPGIAGVQSTPI